MKLKEALSQNQLPELATMLNQINDLYYSLKEKSARVRHPIVLKAVSDLSDTLEIFKSSVQKEFPNFRLTGSPNGYNVIKK
mgnify:CR=1 FL=1